MTYGDLSLTFWGPTGCWNWAGQKPWPAGPRAISCKFVQHPDILEGAIIHLGSLLFKFFKCSVVDNNTFVDQVASCDGLAWIYMFNDEDIDMNLFLPHFGFELVVVFRGVVTLKIKRQIWEINSADYFYIKDNVFLLLWEKKSNR